MGMGTSCRVIGVCDVSVLSVELFDCLVGKLEGTDLFLDVVMEELGIEVSEDTVYIDLAERGFSECDGCGDWGFMGEYSRCTRCDMNANEYQRLASRTLIDRPPFDISPREIMVVWNAIGLAGEAGEVAELVKKGIFHQHGLDVEKMAREIGDVCWYVAALCTTLDLDLGAIMADNIAKLEARYPNGYSSEDSRKRVDLSSSPSYHPE